MSDKSQKAKLVFTTIAAVNGLAYTMCGEIRLTAEEIAKAWENKEYRFSLSASHMKALPENPAGDLLISSHIKKELQLMAHSYSDDCRTYGDTCRSYSDDCHTYSETCKSYSDSCHSYSETCSTQFGSCSEMA